MSDTTIIGGSAVSSSTDTYCTNSDIEDEFGQTAVNVWADLTGSYTSNQKEAAKDKQRLKAYDYINSKLRGGAYSTVPLSVADQPEILSKVEAVIAGLYLMRKRPVSKEDLPGIKVLSDWADKTLKALRKGEYVDGTITRVPTIGAMAKAEDENESD